MWDTCVYCVFLMFYGLPGIPINDSEQAYTVLSLVVLVDHPKESSVKGCKKSMKDLKGEVNTEDLSRVLLGTAC